MKELSVSILKEDFHLELLAGEEGLKNKITSEDIHRPGLEITGFFDHFPNERIQVLGYQEISYLRLSSIETQMKRIQDYVSLRPPCIIVTRSIPIDLFMIDACNDYNVPLLRTADKSTNLISEVNNYLEKALAQEIGVHGVCVNVYGVGMLIRGKSGIGKSELALSLIERGHRLISDDLVLLKKIGPVALIGTHNGSNKEFLSLRGIGLVNILRLYGSGASQSETKINLDIELVPWENGTYYDAMGAEENLVSYLGIDVPTIVLPIRPGRDIASLVEVAAKNWRLKSEGYDAFVDFHQRLKDNRN